MGFVAVYDANVLYPSVLRDLLIRVAIAGLVQAKWTEEILDEVFSNLSTNRPDLSADRLKRTRELMCTAVRDWQVSGYESLVPAISLPDPDDRHVMAAAIKSHAQVIVTFNGRDFPAELLGPWGIEAKEPDDFLMDQFHLDPIELHKAVQGIADSWRNPPGDASDVIDRLERGGLPQIATVLRR